MRGRLALVKRVSILATCTGFKKVFKTARCCEALLPDELIVFGDHSLWLVASVHLVTGGVCTHLSRYLHRARAGTKFKIQKTTN